MKDLYEQLSAAVVSMNAEEVRRLARLVLEEGYPPEEAIEKGLSAGMNRVGELFASREYFVPEVLVCSRAMYAGFDILKEHVLEGEIANKGVVAIGVVEGDFHDIGKNIVKLMLGAAGFRVIDLGKNVPPEKFQTTIADEKPSIVALSTLMTTTMDAMEELTSRLLGDNPSLKIMVGGAPVNSDFAVSIGAHFYGKDAREAVIGAHSLMGLPVEI